MNNSFELNLMLFSPRFYAWKLNPKWIFRPEHIVVELLQTWSESMFETAYLFHFLSKFIDSFFSWKMNFSTLCTSIFSSIKGCLATFFMSESWAQRRFQTWVLFCLNVFMFFFRLTFDFYFVFLWYFLNFLRAMMPINRLDKFWWIWNSNLNWIWIEFEWQFWVISLISSTDFSKQFWNNF